MVQIGPTTIQDSLMFVVVARLKGRREVCRLNQWRWRLWRPLMCV